MTLQGDNGQFMKTPIADGTVNEPPLKAATGTAKEIDAKQDAVLARILGIEPKEAPADTTTPEPSSSDAKEKEPEKSPEKTPARTRAEESLKLLGMKPATIAKMDDGELFELAAHRSKVEAQNKQQVTRLNELEEAAKAPAAKQEQSAPADRDLDFAQAAEPLLNTLGLDKEALPALDAFRKAITGSLTKENEALKESLAQTSAVTDSILVDSVRDQLTGTFPGLSDDATFERVEKKARVLVATGFYADAAPTLRGKLTAAFRDACKIELSQDPAPAVADKGNLSKAKSNGTVTTSSRARAPASETNEQRALRIAMKVLSD